MAVKSNLPDTLILLSTLVALSNCKVEPLSTLIFPALNIVFSNWFSKTLFSYPLVITSPEIETIPFLTLRSPVISVFPLKFHLEFSLTSLGLYSTSILPLNLPKNTLSLPWVNVNFDLVVLSLLAIIASLSKWYISLNSKFCPFNSKVPPRWPKYILLSFNWLSLFNITFAPCATLIWLAA